MEAIGAPTPSILPLMSLALLYEVLLAGPNYEVDYFLIGVVSAVFSTVVPGVIL